MCLIKKKFFTSSDKLNMIIMPKSRSL